MVKGKKVGKYELGKTLGSGSFSKVKLGVDDAGKQYAVKIIDKEQLIRENMEEQLKREISIMKMLNHPFVVGLHDVLQTQNNIYLVLELVTGGELFDRIVSAKKFDEDTGRRFFQQLVVALHFCHKQGVCHRDLKPENLLVDDKGSIKITDFGLANIQAADSGKLLMTVCGTPNYVAPEVLKEKGYKGAEADVWSCGVILFVMLAGYLPFDDPNINVLFQKIDKGEYRMCKTFSEPVKDLISKILITDPSKRPTLDWVIRHPWFTKNWDRSIFDTFNGSLVTPDVITTWSDKVEKEQDVANRTPGAGGSGGSGGGAAAGGGNSAGGGVGAGDALGGFDLITMLSMATMSAMTTNRPVLKVFTRFIVGENCDAALASLNKLLTEMQTSPKMKAETREIKGFMNKQKGLLTYVITVYPIVSPSLAMVEVRRGRGDTFDFHELYHAIIAGLGKLVKSKSVVRDVEQPSGAEEPK
jgi:hypothetical protein